MLTKKGETVYTFFYSNLDIAYYFYMRNITEVHMISEYENFYTERLTDARRVF